MDIHYYDASTSTPHRSELNKKRGDLTATRMYTTEYKPDVEEAVEQDFTLHYRLTDTAQFLDRLLPVQQAIVDSILQKLEVDNKLYDSQSKRWVGFPEPGSDFKENSLYGPFNDIVEAIRLAAEQLRPTTASEVGPTMWVDYHTRSPKTHDSQAAQLRPDVLFALKLVADHATSEEFKGKQAKNPDVFQPIWWLQVIAAVEVKRSDLDKWDDLVKQLIGYLRRILREQLDRRFVFGLTLGPNTMTVLMHDRSGVLGTKTSIDIHEEAAKFVQIIAAFTLLPPAKLGFDPTTRLLVSSNQAHPSYKPTAAFIEAYTAAPYNRRWVIKMNSGQEYMTVRTVSYVQAGFMRGRGPIVWVVVPYGESKQESESKLFVLKQSWQPREVESEGGLYEAAKGMECDNVGKITSHEEVLVCGKPDTTDGLIRQGLDDSTGPGKRALSQKPENPDDTIYTICTNPNDIQELRARESGSPVSRVRTRVVLSTYGWLIKYFSTLPELLHVLRDAIKGHKHLYRNGVLHRDVSPGNILIEWVPGSEADKPSSSGRLIDLDRGKKGKKLTIQQNPEEGLDREKITNILHNTLQSAEITAEKDVSRRALDFFSAQKSNIVPLMGYIYAAVQHASEFRGLSIDRICAPHDLRWKQSDKIFDFDFHSSECRKGSRTGTPPYTSGEVLESNRYFHDHHMFHDAVHDLESFFWVVSHIGLTRKGPGGIRRDELEDENDENEQWISIRRVVFCLFDSPVHMIRANKRKLFSNPDHLEKFVLNNFHPYFNPLKDLLKEWFHVLRLAHQFHAFEYHDIHDMVLEIFDKALESIPADFIDEAGQAVLDKRRVDIEELYGENPFGTLQNSPNPHVSPSNTRQMTPYSPPSSPTPMPAPKRKRTLPAPKNIRKEF